METPWTNHITSKEFEKVYEPAEDSFFLLDTIEADLEFIENTLKPTVCLEIGSGSGLIITAVSKRLKSCYCYATDLNVIACNITNRTGKHNHGYIIDSINMNLANEFRPNLFDMIIFNPPYVLTSTEENQNNDNNLIVYSWAGGIDGCVVINQFIEKLEFMLSSIGVAYLLLLKENNPKIIIENLSKKKFSAEILAERKIIGEHLFILKIIKKSIK